MPVNNIDWKDALSAIIPHLQGDIEGATDTVPENESSMEVGCAKQKLRIDIERKGRNGKTATIISGFTITDEQLYKIAAILKKRLGTGGSARGNEILIQGDRRDDVIKELKSLGLIN